jgi:hypothetical protein
VQDAVLRARVARMFPEVVLDPALSGDKLVADAIMKGARQAMYNTLGGAADGAPTASLATSAAPGRLRESFTYLEGGNTLVGTRPNGERYAIVGIDSAVASRALLEHSLGRAISDDELLTAMSRDLGIALAELHLVEQPADFHLDMKMALLPDGRVLVHDSRQALALEIQWMREDLANDPTATDEDRSALERQIASLEENAWRAADDEDPTVRDLEAAGFEVVRIAGRFFDRGMLGSPMNFVNAEQGLGPDGQPFVISLGGDPRAETYYRDAFSQLFPEGEAPRMYFLDPAFTAGTLEQNGGIGCRAKVVSEDVDAKLR